MSGLKARGLQTGPKLAIGDGALGLWKAISKCFPESRKEEYKVDGNEHIQCGYQL